MYMYRVAHINFDILILVIGQLMGLTYMIVGIPIKFEGVKDAVFFSISFSTAIIFVGKL